MHHVDGADAVTRGQHAIEGAGRSAALNVAEHDVAGFESGAALDFAREDLPDAAQAHVPEFVFAHLGDDRRALRRIDVAGELRAFGNDDDAEVASASVTQANAFGDFLDVERLFGNEDHVGAAGDAAVHGDPSGVAAHDFDHHDALMRFGGGVNAIDGFHRGVDGGVEAETEVGAAEIVVDGLGNAHDLNALLEELLGDA